MNSTGSLFEPLHEDENFRKLIEAIRKPGIQLTYGLDDSQRAHFYAALQEASGKPLIIAVPTDQIAQKITDDLSALFNGQVAFFPAREVAFMHTAASSREISMRRLDALGQFAGGKLKALVAPVDALLYKLAPAKLFKQNVITFAEGDEMEPMELIDRLVTAGYERSEVVEARGQCAVRGGIVDVYPIGSPNALRIEFFDDEVDSIRDFDVMTQRSIERKKTAVLYPASETLLTAEIALQAADRIEQELQRTPKKTDMHGSDTERQKQLEKEYDLLPFDQFVQLTQDTPLEEMPSMWDIGVAETEQTAQTAPQKRKTSSQLSRNFDTVVEALRNERISAHIAGDALIPLLYPDADTIMDYASDCLMVFEQPDRIMERCKNRLLEYEEHFKIALERSEALPSQSEMLLRWEEFLALSAKHSTIAAMPFLHTMEDVKPKGLFKIDGIGASSYRGNLRELVRDLVKWKQDHWRVVIMAGGVARATRMYNALLDLDCAGTLCTEIPNKLESGQVYILPTSFSHGFLYVNLKYAVISEADVFGASKQKTHAKARSGEKIAAFTDLKVGDYVVHENHGIGQYMGTVRLASLGKYRDFLHIRYAGSDKLYVPTDQLDRVQKYIGSEGETPKLNRLSGGEWQRQKAKVRASIQEIAGELVKLYAERASVKGYAFSEDTPWQRQFEDAFEYEETPDQETAIAEIKYDMEQPKVMDRLLCGDVGYGKTEVALRAIFKCVMDGKQAALLAPTTILVQQHFQTILKRFAGFPVNIDMISRFRTAAEQKKLITDLKEGKIDVVVGTHRLLAKDVDFKDLGLLVVDEEQRFGVKHKETIKQLKKSVDVLTLSATPIPRTLHMSMVGIRDMSLLQTPPEERYPVQTYVVEYSDGLVRDAILRELSRNGQVYMLYNRVQTIEIMYTRLKKLVPEARIAIGHGQMREHALEDVMIDFYNGKYDVLLCTTIIEAGLDVPRANTLIVCDADRFGLAQLYQLRGRVGRSNRLAYAYLTVAPNRVLTETADKRLAAIREFTEFGSGFRVAMRDLEIRGTGNLLGSEQSGHMASVGYDLYVKMIEETVRELRGDVQKDDITTKVDLHVDAFLPQEYISSDYVRVEMYKKIASVENQDDCDDLIEELTDRFGDPPKPVMNLLDIAHIKGLCSAIGVDLITTINGQIEMRFAGSVRMEPSILIEGLSGFEKKLHIVAGATTSLQFGVPYSKKADDELLRELLPVMEKVSKKIVELLNRHNDDVVGQVLTKEGL